MFQHLKTVVRISLPVVTGTVYPLTGNVTMIQTVNMGKMNIVVVCLCDKTNNLPMLVW